MDYEDDFSWRTLDPDVDPQDHQDLLVVRFLIENGYIPEHFDGAPPPASKAVVANLEERKVKIYPLNSKRNVEKCVICLKLDPKDEDDYEDCEEEDEDDDDNEEEQPNQCNDECGARFSAKEAFYEKTFKVMPCSHAFHSECILPWLEKTNSCPLCRHELETDDPSYERRRAERARAIQREKDIEILHNSMFG